MADWRERGGRKMISHHNAEKTLKIAQSSSVFDLLLYKCFQNNSSLSSLMGRITVFGKNRIFLWQTIS